MSYLCKFQSYLPLRVCICYYSVAKNNIITIFFIKQNVMLRSSSIIELQSTFVQEKITLCKDSVYFPTKRLFQFQWRWKKCIHLSYPFAWLNRDGKFWDNAVKYHYKCKLSGCHGYKFIYFHIPIFFLCVCMFCWNILWTSLRLLIVQEEYKWFSFWYYAYWM